MDDYDVPMFIIHGDDDQIVPIEASANLTVARGSMSRVEGLPGSVARPVRDPHRTVRRCGTDDGSWPDEVEEVVKKRVRQSFDQLNNHDWDTLMTSIAPNVHHRFLGAHAIGRARMDSEL